MLTPPTAKPAIDPTLVGIPYLNQDALDLLSNCCTSKEYDMWMSLGPNWIQTIDTNLLKASRLPSSFQPIFSDGWAPIIGELELIGLVMPSGSPASFGTDHDYLAPVRDERAPPSAAASAATTQQDRQHRHRHKQGRDPARLRHPSAGGYSAAEVSPQMVPSGAGAGQKSSRARNGHHLVASRHLSEPAVGAYDALGQHDMYAEPAIDGPTATTTTTTTKTSSPYRSSREIYHRPEQHHHHNHHNYKQLHAHPSAGSSSNRSGSVERRPMRLLSNRALTKSASSQRILSSADFHHTPPSHYPPPAELDDYHRPVLPHDRYSAKDQYLPPAGRLAPMKQQQQQRRLYGDGQPIYPAPDEETDDYFLHADHEHDDPQHSHEMMLLDLGPDQLDWLYELQSRGAMIVRVLFSRAANNDKELSVRRGELLEILDDSRKWWRARNIDLQVAHVPHTIVAPMQAYQTLDDLLANSNLGAGSAAASADHHLSSGEDPSFLYPNPASSTPVGGPMHYAARHPPQSHQLPHPHPHPHPHPPPPLLLRDQPDHDWHTAGARNSKNAGAFRYF